MTTAAFVILVLFSLSDGSVRAMSTLDSFDTPLVCSMRAHRANLKVDDRTYVCLSSRHAEQLLALQVSANAPTPLR
jgi:hypothetical protein